MAKLKLILTRHGETEWNAAHRIQGHADIGLNEKGEAQAVALAGHLEGMDISAIYSSDLSRALKTAQAIAGKFPEAEFIKTSLLRERDWGALEGHTWEQLTEKFPDDVKQMKSNSPDYAPPGGESKLTALQRVDKFIQELAETREGQTVVAVSHGGLSALFLRRALGLPFDTRAPFRIDNCSISELHRDESGFWVVAGMNCVCHLKKTGLI